MLNRRGFLKVCAVASSAVLLPEFRLVEPQDELLDGENWIATVREVAAYDINTDEILVRHDILGPGHQFSVTNVMPCDAEGLHTVRKAAASALRDKMSEVGWTVADLRPLSMPPGISSGDDMLRLMEQGRRS